MQKKWLFVAGTVVLMIAITVSLVFSTNLLSLCKNAVIGSEKLDNEADKEFEGLVQSIPTDIMMFKGSDGNWAGEYRVVRKEDALTPEFYVIRHFGGYENQSFKYKIEAKAGKAAGTTAFASAGMYGIQVPFIPEKDETIKVTIEWGSEKSVLELTNRMTEDIITPEKALELFKGRFSQIKDLSRLSGIRFQDGLGRKTWYIPFADGGVDIDAITGEIGDPIYTN